eukprot:4837121-Pyramimonas_sp.AAC.1
MGDVCKHNLGCTQGSALEPSADSSASGSVISWPGGWPECNEGYVFKDKVRGKVGAVSFPRITSEGLHVAITSSGCVNLFHIA